MVIGLSIFKIFATEWRVLKPNKNSLQKHENQLHLEPTLTKNTKKNNTILDDILYSSIAFFKIPE